MIAAASRSFCTGTGQGEGKRESPASKRAPGFLRIMRPVSEEPSAPLSHRVPRTSQSPKGRPVCQSVRILIIVRITVSSQLRFQSQERNGDPGVPGNSRSLPQ